MRATEEILSRIAEVEKDDWMGTQRSDLVCYLPWSAAASFLKDGATEDAWDPAAADSESVRNDMQNYMEFAWSKANNCRGISASRSIDHMRVWLWMLGRDAASVWVDATYYNYGKPQLRAICEAFGWDWKQWDDGRWANYEDGDGVPAPATVAPLPAEKGGSA